MSTAAHVFVLVVTISTLSFILLLVRGRKLRAKYALLWLSIGTVMVVLAISPAILDTVAAWVGIAYPPTMVFILAIVLLVLVSVHTSFELSRLEERTRVLAEELALFRAEAGATETPPSATAAGDGTTPRGGGRGRL